jgi:hypothetical protein
VNAAAAFTVGVALVSQVTLVALLADQQGGVGPDSVEYSRYAQNLLDRGLYSYDGVHSDRMRQPLYPLFLAGVYTLVGRNSFGVYGAQVLIGCLCVFLTFTFALMARVGCTAATAAALLMGLYPPFVRLAGLLGTEAISALLWISIGCLFVRTVRERGRLAAVALGAVGGLHALTRPITALTLPFLWWGMWRSGEVSRRTLGQILLSGFAFVAVVAPWGVRNAVVLGSPTILSSEGGVNVYLAMRPDREQIWAGEIGWFVQSAEVRALIGDDYYISERADARFRAKALELFLERPADALWQGIVGAVRAWLYMPGGLTVTRGRPWLWVPVIGIPSGLLVLALYGGLTAPRAANLLLVWLPAYFTLLHVPVLARPRFMLPLFPFVAVGAAVGCERLLARARSAGVRTGSHLGRLSTRKDA